MKLSWGNSKYVTNQITSRLRLAECWRRLWSASKQPPLLCTKVGWRLQPLLLWMLLLLFSCNNWTQLFDIFSCIFWYHGKPLLYSRQEKISTIYVLTQSPYSKVFISNISGRWRVQQHPSFAEVEGDGQKPRLQAWPRGNCLLLRLVSHDFNLFLWQDNK